MTDDPTDFNDAVYQRALDEFGTDTEITTTELVEDVDGHPLGVTQDTARLRGMVCDISDMQRIARELREEGDQ